MRNVIEIKILVGPNYSISYNKNNEASYRTRWQDIEIG